jgi:SP family general alpha glucoside:H+ symporter-like MFS transporter
MILCWAFIPESPWFHARRGNKEAAMKSLKQLYGNVEGYDFEEEYSIIARTIEHENVMLEHKPRYRDVFRGNNLKRTLTVMLLAACGQLGGLAVISTYSTCEWCVERSMTLYLSQTSSRWRDSAILSWVV